MKVSMFELNGIKNIYLFVLCGREKGSIFEPNGRKKNPYS